MAVKVIWRMQEPLIDLGHKRQLIEILDRLPGSVGDDFAALSPPDQALNRGEVGSTGLRREPVAHCIFVLSDSDGLDSGRHGQSFFRQRGDVTAYHQDV